MTSTSDELPSTAVPSDSRAEAPPLPEEPLLVIEPSKRWVPVDLGQIWAYRGLLYFLVWRDLKVRYKQTIFGAAWAIIPPVFTMIIFSIFFGKLAKVPSEGLPYPIFAYAGLLPWTFFSNTVAKAGGSLFSEARLMSKVYFPRIIVPMAAVTGGVVDLSISFLVYFVLILWYHMTVGWSLVFLIPLVLMTGTLSFAVGTILASLTVRYRDLRQVLPFLIQIWMFASPVIYPTNMVPARWRWVLILNPLTGIIDGFRAVLLPSHPVASTAVLASLAITLVLFVIASFAFRRVERTFVDVI